MPNNRPPRFFIILLLGFLTAISPFAIDMYLPAFSLIAKDFGTTPARISLSVASYFIGLSFGQLLYGPLLDRFGRKKPLYIGLTVFVIACVACMQTHNVESLIAFRFIQALGGCVAWVAAMTMVRDFFPVEESAKIFSTLVLILGLSPLLAPTIGGYISVWLGWQWVFIFLALLALVIVVLVGIFLPEPHPADPSVSLKAGPMLQTFFSILKERTFLIYTLAGAFSFSTMFIYVAGSPAVFMEHYKVTPQVYGGIFALLSVGFIGGNQVNILLLKKYSSQRIFKSAVLFQVLVSILYFIGVYYGWLNLYSTIAMLFIVLSCLGLTYPNASAIALSPFTKNLGSASALLGFLQLGIAGGISSFVGMFETQGSLAIAVLLPATAIISMIILAIGTRRIG
ncbi:MAG: multidrug effflux MFS transporter [Chitinophagaceae bacterium]|nr:multidrug effflux MFS transporter [Chitinophagaceae bacterium]